MSGENTLTAITEDAISEMVVNAAIHCRNKTEGEKRRGEGMDAFGLTFAMELLTGKPKEECLDMLLDVQKKMNEMAQIIEN
jgi:hypothetical protein